MSTKQTFKSSHQLANLIYANTVKVVVNNLCITVNLEQLISTMQSEELYREVSGKVIQNEKLAYIYFD